MIAPNGKIYGVPSAETHILEINLGIRPQVADMQIPSNLANLATSNYNKYHNKL